MPISKTCKYCGYYHEGSFYSTCQRCKKLSNFTPNADWLYIEGLHQRIIELEIGEKLIEKENEELKRKIQSYKYEREKLHGYLAKSEVNK